MRKATYFILALIVILRDLVGSYLTFTNFAALIDLLLFGIIWGALFLKFRNGLSIKPLMGIVILVGMMLCTAASHDHSLESLKNVGAFVRYLPLLVLVPDDVDEYTALKYYRNALWFFFLVVIVQMFSPTFLLPLPEEDGVVTALKNLGEKSAIFTHTISLSYFIVLGRFFFSKWTPSLTLISLFLLFHSGVTTSLVVYMGLEGHAIAKRLGLDLKTLTGAIVGGAGIVLIWLNWAFISNKIDFVLAYQRGLILREVIFPNYNYQVLLLGNGGCLDNLTSIGDLSGVLNAQYYIGLAEDVYLFLFPVYFGFLSVLVYAWTVVEVSGGMGRKFLVLLSVLCLVNQAPENSIFAFIAYSGLAFHQFWESQCRHARP